MVGGRSKRILRAGLWAVALIAGGNAQADGGAQADGRARRESLAAYYGMEDAPRGNGLLRAVVMDLHNGERAALGLPLLEWDEALAKDAAGYAAQMSRTGLFRHSPRAARAVPSGENLWMGTRGLFGYDRMIGAFLDEREHFRPQGRLPDISRTGRWQDVGHYTQMIWRGTRKIGCALGEGARDDYLVCRYYPAGNAFGQGPLDPGPDGAAPVLASAGR